MMKFHASNLILFLVAGTVADAEPAGEWSRFRGPDGLGVAAEQEVPVKPGKETLAWSVPLPGPGSSSPVLWGDSLFVTAEKLPGNFYASPLLIGGKLYCLSRDGEMFVAAVGTEFQLLATSDLKPGDEITWTDATPAVADDSLYVRLGARLDCYR